MFGSNITDSTMRVLSKLIRLASKKVYYFSKTLNKVYFVYPRIPSSQPLYRELSQQSVLHIHVHMWHCISYNTLCVVTNIIICA